MLWRQSCAFQFHCQYSLEIAWTHQQTVDFDWFTPRFFTVGGPQYQRLHSNNISKTGSKLGDGFQKHLPFKILREWMKWWLKASRSPFQPSKSFQPKQGNLQAFFFDGYQNLEQKFMLQIYKLNPHWILFFYIYVSKILPLAYLSKYKTSK